MNHPVYMIKNVRSSLHNHSLPQSNAINHKFLTWIGSLLCLQTSYHIYRVVHLTGTPLIFLSTGSHVNWPGTSLSVSGYKENLYSEILWRFQLKKNPVYTVLLFVELLCIEQNFQFHSVSKSRGSGQGSAAATGQHFSFLILDEPRLRSVKHKHQDT